MKLEERIADSLINGQLSQARKQAKKISWRNLFIFLADEVYPGDHGLAVHKTDLIKQTGNYS